MFTKCLFCCCTFISTIHKMKVKLSPSVTKPVFLVNQECQILTNLKFFVVLYKSNHMNNELV